MSEDASLSLAGIERAQQLSQVLEDAKIPRIHVTEVLRTAHARRSGQPIRRAIARAALSAAAGFDKSREAII